METPCPSQDGEVAPHHQDGELALHHHRSSLAQEHDHRRVAGERLQPRSRKVVNLTRQGGGADKFVLRVSNPTLFLEAREAPREYMDITRSHGLRLPTAAHDRLIASYLLFLARP